MTEIIDKNWYKVSNEEELNTPSLLVYPLRIKKNIESMIQIAGGVNRLWPHIKTHKMSKIINLLKDYGILRFKASTISEVKMLIQCKVDEILFAMQPSKDKFLKLLDFQKKNPNINFSTLIDNIKSFEMFSQICSEQDQTMNLWLDINNGMNRTGVEPNEKAIDLSKSIFYNNYLSLMGIHVYDGHIRPFDIAERKQECDFSFRGVSELINKIQLKNITIKSVIAGGTPTFLPHSQRKDVFLSPGTTLLWDLGYKKLWKESPFLNAAVIVTRIISKPSNNLLCFDLGHKAVASEMPLPRIQILGLEDVKHIKQSEEHLVVESTEAKKHEVGKIFYAIPYHICPTVAKYNKAYTVSKSKKTGTWDIDARDYI